MSDRQSRAFLGILYLDAENYDCNAVLVRLGDYFSELAYITHDQDVNEQGELKKPHIHWVGRRYSPSVISAVSNAIKVPENDIEYCKSFKASLRYLVHADSKDKFQYDPDTVTANFPYVECLKNKIEAMKARMIFNYIHENVCTIDSLAAWSLDNDCWSEFRRNWALWSSLIREVHYHG